MKYIASIWIILFLLFGGLAMPFDAHTITSSNEKIGNNQIIAKHSNSKILYNTQIFVIEDEEEEEENDDTQYPSFYASLPSITAHYYSHTFSYVEKKTAFFNHRSTFIPKKLFLRYQALKIAC